MWPLWEDSEHVALGTVFAEEKVIPCGGCHFHISTIDGTLGPCTVLPGCSGVWDTDFAVPSGWADAFLYVAWTKLNGDNGISFTILEIFLGDR